MGALQILFMTADIVISVLDPDGANVAFSSSNGLGGMESFSWGAWLSEDGGTYTLFELLRVHANYYEVE